MPDRICLFFSHSVKFLLESVLLSARNQFNMSKGSSLVWSGILWVFVLLKKLCEIFIVLHLLIFDWNNGFELLFESNQVRQHSFLVCYKLRNLLIKSTDWCRVIVLHSSINYVLLYLPLELTSMLCMLITYLLSLFYLGAFLTKTRHHLLVSRKLVILKTEQDTWEKRILWGTNLRNNVALRGSVIPFCFCAFSLE